MSAQNFSSRKVTLVAMTRMRPPACRSAASFRAGSMPMMILSGYWARRDSMAAAVAVLQATTMALIPRGRKAAMEASVRLRTSSVERVPYGAFWESPKYKKRSPPSPESNTKIHSSVCSMPSPALFRFAGQMTLPTGSLYQIFYLVATGADRGISGLPVAPQPERGRPTRPAPLFENGD